MDNEGEIIFYADFWLMTARIKDKFAHELKINMTFLERKRNEFTYIF